MRNIASREVTLDRLWTYVDYFLSGSQGKHEEGGIFYIFSTKEKSFFFFT